MSISIIEKKKMISIISDWVVLAVVLLLLWITSKIQPFERQFRLDDDTISHPYKEKETLSNSLLIVSTVGIPALIITIYHLFKRDFKFSFHQSIIGLSVSVSLTVLISLILKTLIGRFRPDFLSRCQVDFSKVEEIYKTYNISSQINYGPRNLYNTSICSNPNKSIVAEGRRSFPSGHSSFSFSTLTYTSLFLAGKFHLFDGNYILWKLLIVIIPNILAMLVAITRLIDYRHHWQDVVVGSLLGIMFSFISYFYYFPSLNSPEPYKPLQGRLRKYNIFQDQKTLPVYRDKDSEVTDV